MLRKNVLRSGYTTGACAAAAAKAAALLLLQNTEVRSQKSDKKGRLGSVRCAPSSKVEIPFPDGSRVRFAVHDSGVGPEGASAWASVIKDAGDDPDVTNGAEIKAEVRKSGTAEVFASGLVIKSGKGVGTVTKPGLSVAVGEPAINPVPRKMIENAVKEALAETSELSLEVVISVPKGEELAKKTLNERLGITGGISILGTTGIVRPISSEAWTATITASMDVAKATGSEMVVLSAGRASERAHMRKYQFPEEAYVMMGDYLEFSLVEARQHAFRQVHLAAQWAKMIKIAMATPQTHVRHGALDTKRALLFLESIDSRFASTRREFNTARDIFDFITSTISDQKTAIFTKVCTAAKRYSEGLTSGIPVTAHLVSYEGEIIADSE